jgi:2'-5' RNA ligase
VVEVPEAEALVGGFRDRFDPSAAEGVPAHVTVLYPFLKPSRLSAAVLRTLKELFGGVAPFRAKLTAVRRFPGALYLAPVPAAKFRRLTQLVFARFPETPPYEGRFVDVVPHLTVAHAESSTQVTRIAREFRAAAKGKLPIEMRVDEIVLLERRAGRWRRRCAFSLGRRRA